MQMKHAFNSSACQTFRQGVQFHTCIEDEQRNAEFLTILTIVMPPICYRFKLGCVYRRRWPISRNVIL